MDLTLREVQNNIGEIELGDVFYCGKNNEYYIVIMGWWKKTYYLQKLNGDNEMFSYGQYYSLESLRQVILKYDNSLKFVHYPAKEYRLELVKK